MGGTDDIENLVRLTPEEHYLCHQLLVKIHKGTQYYHRLVMACAAMSNLNSSVGRRASKLKMFGWIRREVAREASIRMKGNPSPHKGKKQSPEVVAAKSARMKGRKLSPEALASNHAAAARRVGVPMSREAVEKSAATRRGKPNPKGAEANRGKPSGMLGKSQSPETRAKIAESRKRTWELKKLAHLQSTEKEKE
jgi:hypothetical protein